MLLTPGTRLGPYTIESLIGSGGMGEVYKAHDGRLDRTVAIKRMMADDLSRFQTEARAIAAINHPHICQIYDVGPDYLVLEYLQGEPLGGPLTRDDAVRLASQVADALHAAHERGILHRDLKPANIMVVRQGGAPHAKLLDFGVARLTSADHDATKTVTGTVTGTPAYMSPEQAAGQRLDARSDVFSFGAVLYELLAGTRAFTGDSHAHILSAVLRDEPGPFDAPPALRLIVERCLAKDPDRRFQTMADVKQALEDLTRGSGDATASIAVLPFVNLSADPENEYFGDGLAEEIINALAAWSRAKADLDRAMQADPSYAKPHAELALAYFIRGMHFMQPMREVGPLVRAEVTRALELDPTDPQPRFVLGAIALAHDYQWEEAAEHFAASMHGPHVPGHARWIHASLYLRGLGRFEESAAEMARAAEEDPLNATWQAIWAAHLIDAQRVEQAMTVACRSIEIDPTYFLTHHMLGEASWAAGRRDEAVAAFERAHALAPWFGVSSGWLAAAHRLAGRGDKADALLATLGPTSKPLWGRVFYHVLMSELDAAADWYEQMIEERDPFALLYARTPTLRPLREHHRWPELAALMKLPAVARSN